MPLSARVLIGLLIARTKACHEEGYLCIDDVVVEKAYAKELPWAGWS